MARLAMFLALCATLSGCFPLMPVVPAPGQTVCSAVVTKHVKTAGCASPQGSTSYTKIRFGK